MPLKKILLKQTPGVEHRQRHRWDWNLERDWIEEEDVTGGGRGGYLKGMMRITMRMRWWCREEERVFDVENAASELWARRSIMESFKGSLGR